MVWHRERAGRVHPERRASKTVTLLLGCVTAAFLMTPGPAAAHQAFCEEIFNPHGQTVPPAGSTTLPGQHGGQNEDGFYQVGACSVPGSVVCPPPGGFGGPIFGGLCTCAEGSTPEPVTLTDGCPGETGGGTGTTYDTSFPFGTIVKFTEANGKTPTFKPMAGNNSPNGGGQSVAVDWHIWGQGDLFVCSATDPSSCVCCHVPPPPK
jgi:hypothetical protein